MKIFVGGLNFNTTNEELADLFSQFGQVSEANIVMDKFSGRSRGFGFVTMEQDEAQKAIDSLNDTSFMGRTIIVNEARPKTESFGGGGRDNNRSFRSNDRFGGGGRDSGFKKRY